MTDLSRVIDELVKFIPEEYQPTVAGIRKAIAYLRKYGYVHSIKSITIGDVIAAVELFQQFAGLKQDGIVGPKTLRAMEWPRCQCKDVQPEGVMENRAAMKWGTKKLRYYIARRDSDLSSQEWAATMAKAFKQWSDVADLEFVRVDSQQSAQLILSVGSGRGDGFDGSGGTLAWAQLPRGNNYRGQLLSRFDTAETWVIDPRKRGILLLNVACHEFGHLLGLDHSRVNTALMAPFYNPRVDKPQANDDIKRMQALYGKPKSQPDPDPDPDPDPNPDPDPDPDPQPTPFEGLEITLQVKQDGVKGIKIPGYKVTRE